MKIAIVLLFSAVALSHAEVIDFSPCQGHVESQCVVNEVRITPCANPSKCVIRGGKTYTISYDFTPRFNADSLTTKISAEVGGAHVEWGDSVETDACASGLSCPLRANERQSFSIEQSVQSTKTRAGSYNVKWELLNEDESKSCCFAIGINVKKR